MRVTSHSVRPSVDVAFRNSSSRKSRSPPFPLELTISQQSPKTSTPPKLNARARGGYLWGSGYPPPRRSNPYRRRSLVSESQDLRVCVNHRSVFSLRSLILSPLGPSDSSQPRRSQSLPHCLTIFQVTPTLSHPFGQFAFPLTTLFPHVPLPVPSHCLP